MSLRDISRKRHKKRHPLGVFLLLGKKKWVSRLGLEAQVNNQVIKTHHSLFIVKTKMPFCFNKKWKMLYN